MDELFGQAAARLARFPHLGRLGRVPETRELVAHERYILVYEIDDDTVWILTLLHTSDSGRRRAEGRRRPER
jgi:plasmid stabilization system protein ParE